MSQAHILLVEDTLTQSLLMQHILESSDYQVSVAKDGSKALAFLESQKPDLILSDISMPEMDGYELCKRVKENPQTQAIPFVMLSSFHDANEIVKVINCGADSFILKRFDHQYVTHNVKNALANLAIKPSNDSLSINYDNAEYNLSSNPQQLAAMLLSAFNTVVHLIPLVNVE